MTFRFGKPPLIVLRDTASGFPAEILCDNFRRNLVKASQSSHSSRQRCLEMTMIDTCDQVRLIVCVDSSSAFSKTAKAQIYLQLSLCQSTGASVSRLLMSSQDAPHKFRYTGEIFSPDWFPCQSRVGDVQFGIIDATRLISRGPERRPSQEPCQSDRTHLKYVRTVFMLRRSQALYLRRHDGRINRHGCIASFHQHLTLRSRRCRVTTAWKQSSITSLISSDGILLMSTRMLTGSEA